MKYKIGILVKNELYCDSLVAILKQLTDFEIIYINSFLPTPEVIIEKHLNILLMDLTFNKEDNLAFINKVEESGKQIKIFLVSQYHEPLFYNMYLKSSIAGIIFLHSDKKSIETQLLQAIKTT